LTFVQYKTMDYAQEQFGFVLLSASKLTSKFTVDNLRSNEYYNIVFCGESLSRASADSQTISFTSFDNNVKIVSATFTFDDNNITKQQEIDLGCFFASQFRLLEYNVISENRNSCYDKYPDVKLPTVYTTPPYVFSPAAPDTSSYTYSSRRRLLQGQFGITDPSSNQCEIAEKTPQPHPTRNLAGTTTTVNTTKITYIFYGNAQTSGADAIDTRIQAKLAVLDPTATATDKTFASDYDIFVQNYAGGFPKITAATYNGLINLITPAFAAYPAIEVSNGVYWIAMSDVKLESSGYIYAVAVLTNTGTPNTIQIRHGLNANDQSALFNLTLSAGDDEIVSLNFTGLANYTTYDLFYYATNEDISRFALTTTVKKLTVTTAMGAPGESNGPIMKVSWTLVILLAMALIWN